MNMYKVGNLQPPIKIAIVTRICDCCFRCTIHCLCDDSCMEAFNDGTKNDCEDCKEEE